MSSSLRGVIALASLCALAAAGLTVWVASGTRDPDNSAGLIGTRESEPIAARHPRVVALGPALSQILREMHCADLQVGRHASDAWCDQSLAVCGDQSGVDYEALIAVKPTHVLLQWGDRPLPDRLLLLAKEHGWELINVPLLSLHDVSGAVITVYDRVISAELRAMDAEIGLRTWNSGARHQIAPEPAERHARRAALSRAAFNILTRFDQSLVTDPSLARVGRVLLLYQSAADPATGRASLAALGPGSYHHDILLRIGARASVVEGKPFMPLDAEDIVALAPDAIILIRPLTTGQPAPKPLSPEQIIASAGLGATLPVPAFAAGRVAIVDDPLALIPGTNLMAVAQSFRDVITLWSQTVTTADPRSVPGSTPARSTPTR